MGVSRTDWVLLITLTIMWGSAFAFTKIAVAVFSPSAIVVVRLIIAAVLLGVLVALQRRAIPRSPRLWLFMVAIALLGNVVPFYLIAWGQQDVDSGLAGILMSIMPLVVLLLAHFYVAGERLNWHRIAGFVLGFSGVVVLTGPSVLLSLQGVSSELLAMLAVLGGAVCYGVSAILSRLRPESDPIESAAITIVLAALMSLPLMPADALQVSHWLGRTDALLAVIALGVFSTALPAIVYFHLITSAGPHFVSFLNYLIPLWAVALGAVLLGERPTLQDLVALVIILGGIAVARRETQRPEAG
jgi:drug/metabolite transporter (DMT)-like permease